MTRDRAARAPRPGDAGSAITTPSPRRGRCWPRCWPPASGAAARPGPPDGPTARRRRRARARRRGRGPPRAPLRSPRRSSRSPRTGWRSAISTLLIAAAVPLRLHRRRAFRAGLAGVGEAVVLAAAGLGVAALLTPWLVHRLGRPRTVQVALLVAAVTQLALAALLSAADGARRGVRARRAGQVIKLCTDAAVQSEVADEVLGRVFALYDIVFNVGYVLAVAAAALLSPPDGSAPLAARGAAAALPARPARLTTSCCAGPPPSGTRSGRQTSCMAAQRRSRLSRAHRHGPLRRRSPRPSAAAPPRPAPGRAGRAPSAAPAGACTPARPAGPGRSRAAP